MPCPVSVTAGSIESSTGFTEIVILPFSVNFTAFPSRFMTTP
jgi:hypothetical protein